MALPKLNNAPRYEMAIPSTGKKVRYRPFLVKEEKNLMMASESGDSKSVFLTLADTITACVEDKVSPRDLTSFDIEYMFLQMRAKSVGESSKVGLKCSECGTTNEVTVQLNEIAVSVPKVDKNIQLTADISIDVDYPTFYDIVEADLANAEKASTDQAFQLIRSCIRYVNTNEERIDLRETSDAEVQEFLDSMNTEQFEKIKSFVDTMPRLSHDISFECSNCQHKNELTLEGVQNFLS